MDWQQVFLDGLVYALVGSAYLVLLLAIDNRMFLNKGDYPEDVLAAVAPRTQEETRKAALLSIPWLVWLIGYPLYSTLRFNSQATISPAFWTLFAHAFLILFCFWLVDLVVLDGILFCLITPGFVVIPGTEGFPGYKDFGMHLRGHFTKGLAGIIVSALILAGIVRLL